MSTAQHNIITVAVDGKSIGVFAGRSGGETTAEVTRYRPGGMQDEELYPGLPTTGDVTVSGSLKGREDLARHLRTRTGLAPASITEQPLDNNKLPFGKPTTWSGLLTGVNTGDADAGSNEPRVLELTIAASAVS